MRYHWISNTRHAIFLHEFVVAIATNVDSFFFLLSVHSHFRLSCLNYCAQMHIMLESVNRLNSMKKQQKKEVGIVKFFGFFFVGFLVVGEFGNIFFALSFLFIHFNLVPIVNVINHNRETRFQAFICMSFKLHFTQRWNLHW